MATTNQPAPSGPQTAKSAHFEPYIASETHLREFTVRGVIIGTLLGIIFGASSLYLVLKVGLTVSASIPVAVISVALFRLCSKFGMKDATILENNIVQTAGSAGESIAFGVGVTMPAIMILGFDLELTRVMLVACLGGLLGILMMIPLRRALIVQQHGVLKYPEGTACAEVLKAGASEESKAHASPSAKREMQQALAAGLGKNPGAKTIFTGFAVGLLYKTLNVAFKGWKDVAEKIFGADKNADGNFFDRYFKSGSISAEISPELLGVGYIIGPHIAAIMCAGGVLSYLILIPMIKFFGSNLAGPLAPGTIPISAMSPNQIRGAYVLYIGAGAVAAGGVVSLLRALPTIWHGLKEGLRDFSGERDAVRSSLRTDNDLSMKFVLIGVFGLIGIIVAAPTLQMNLGGALMIIVCGFLFVTVSSRLTGEIGSTSNPISGMTVATLLLTCLVFLVVGWTAPSYYVTALSIGGIVCIASSNGGTTSQDLKTGYLVGSTPRFQQIAILVGALASALVIGPILLMLNSTATVYVSISEIAPGLKTDISQLNKFKLVDGPQGKHDTNVYRSWQKTDTVGGPPGEYFVNSSGAAVYLVDPGINGTHTKRPDGTEVRKLDAPKATLMSYIIKGILDQKLPWGLVLLGVMIALVLEMSGIASLAFAVGVYLPLASTSPIWIGGMVRWLVDRKMRHHHRESNLTEAQLVAESDKSPGVLLCSGYVAGGAIAGIVIAFKEGLWDVISAWAQKEIPTSAWLFEKIDRFGIWNQANNPFLISSYADLLSLIPFAILIVFLYLVAREKLLASKPAVA